MRAGKLVVGGNRRKRRSSSKRPAAVLGCALLTAVASASDSAKVGIDGGVDPTGHHYVWTVQNSDTSPIVRVEFPHFHADLFFTPEGWSGECTALVNVGYKGKPGSCVASSTGGTNGIMPGSAAEFRMRISPLPTRHGTGRVLIRFADGRDASVTGVALPVPDPLSDKYLSLIVLGILFAVFITVKSIRRSKTRGANGSDATTASSGVD